MHSLLFLYYLDLFSLMRVSTVPGWADELLTFLQHHEGPASCQILRGSITEAKLLLSSVTITDEKGKHAFSG